MVPSPLPYHQIICRNLEEQLWKFVQAQRLGEVLFAPCDVVLSEETVVQPDILFISSERVAIIHKEEIRGAPDLIVEILSPATAQRDRTYKRTLYARSGVKEYWIVDPDAQTIEVLALGGRGYKRAGIYGREQMLESPLLTELKISLAEVFGKLP